MKTIRLIIALFVSVGILIPVCYTLLEMGLFYSTPVVQIKNTVSDDSLPPLRVVADFDFSPYSFFDEKDNVTGFDVEIVNEIANRLNRKVEIEFNDWISCKKALQQGDADLILGLEIFSNMQGVVKTVAISEDELLIFGKEKINGVASLRGKRVGLIGNSVIEKIFDLNCTYIPYYTNTQIIEAINSGNIDFGICHGAVAKKILEKTKYPIEPSVVLMKSYPAIGVREDLVELRNQINEIITDMSSEGFIKKLDTKWVERFTKKTSLKQVIASDSKFYLVYFVCFIIFLLLTMILYLQYYHAQKEYNTSLEYQKKMLKQFDMLSAVSEVYITMYSIDLVNDVLTEIHSSDMVRNIVEEGNNASEKLKEAARRIVIKEDQEAALKFVDLSTLPERLKGRKNLMCELRANEIGWFNCQFVALDYDKDGNVTEVLYTNQSIDEVKKENDKLKTISLIDELTKLYNRRKYQSVMDDILERNPSDIAVIGFDVNGLKYTNDNIGHVAGDEIICGTAECIRKVFKDGTCCRIGGDEFIVILEGKSGELINLVKSFKDTVKKWHGKFVPNLAVSVGYATSQEIKDYSAEKMKELIEMADRRMYEDKALFYKLNGNERRSR